MRTIRHARTLNDLRDSPWKGFLAQFFSLKDAWNALATDQPPPATLPSDAQMALSPIEAKRLADYLRNTRFADVEQGITELKLDRIPAGL